MDQFDLIVIGTGQGGVPLATAFADEGKKVAIVERFFFGGSCVNFGCTPTKTMVASARTAWRCREAARWGVSAGDVSVDFSKVMELKQEQIEKGRKGVKESLTDNENIEAIVGHGRFTTADTIEVELNQSGSRTIKSDTIVINTGTRGRIPKVQGLTEVPYLTASTLMYLDEQPEHLIIFGGGFLALEFGQLFRRLGSQVSIIEQSEQVADREDREIADLMQEYLTEDGVNVYCDSEISKVSGKEGDITVHFTRKGDEKKITGTHLLIAAGRRPNSDDLGLDKADVRADDKGNVTVNEKLETNVKGVYAMGDVKGGPAFTHVSYDDFRILKANLLEGGNKDIKDRLVPYTVFTDPQLGRIGLSEEQAKEKGIAYKVASMPMDKNSRAVETGLTRGLMKVLVSADDDSIIGVAMLGDQGGEMMTALQMAMYGKLPYTQVRDMMIAHPLYCESFNNLFQEVENPS
ncbi:MAG: mercuric reductase [Cyclobacteriaceae bacterium]